jgi:hypothetical protein
MESGGSIDYVMVVNSHHFEEELNPDPEPHESEKLDPDPQ